jgi:hypothetical protein
MVYDYPTTLSWGAGWATIDIGVIIGDIQTT